MKKLLSAILFILLFSVQVFAEQDYQLWKFDVENRDANHSVTHVTTGGGFTITATDTSTSETLGEVFKLTLWDGYKYVRNQVLDIEANGGLLPSLTTTQRDLLTNMMMPILLKNSTTGHIESYNGTTWKSSAEESNEISIVASTNQTQGGGTALTMEMNFIETVANDNDAVTLESVSNGAQQTIINDGVNILQIFPASGDDLGNGTDISTHLDEHEEIAFWGKDDSTWHIRYTSESFHASMYEQDNSTEFIIHADSETHCYHSTGLIAGDLGSWTFDAGSAGALVLISSIADNSGGTILVTTNVAHGGVVGDILCQTGLTDSAYVGIFTVLTVPTTATYTVTAPWTATDTGFTDRPAYLTVKDIATGFYNLEWASTMTVSGTGITLSFDLHDGMTTIPGSKAGFKFANSANVKQPNGLGEKIFVSGSRVFFTITNDTDDSNITPKHLKVRLEHI